MHEERPKHEASFRRLAVQTPKGKNFLPADKPGGGRLPGVRGGSGARRARYRASNSLRVWTKPGPAGLAGTCMRTK